MCAIPGRVVRGFSVPISAQVKTASCQRVHKAIFIRASCVCTRYKCSAQASAAKVQAPYEILKEETSKLDAKREVKKTSTSETINVAFLVVVTKLAQSSKTNGIKIVSTRVCGSVCVFREDLAFCSISLIRGK